MTLHLKPLLLAAALAVTASAATAGENVIGVRGGYFTRHENAVAGLYYQYRFSSHFRLSPNVDYIVRHRNVDALGFNVNAHFPFAMAPRWNVYPLAGVSMKWWSYRHTADESGYDADVTTRKTRLGINTGAGIEFYATPTLKLSLEAKMTWVKSYSGGMFTLGIAYVF